MPLATEYHVLSEDVGTTKPERSDAPADRQVLGGYQFAISPVPREDELGRPRPIKRPLFSDLTTNDNLRRLGGLPILFVSGRDNAVFSPEATLRSYETLCDQFGDKDYRRRVIPGYGHLDCWIGRNAWKDVYPVVRREVDRVCRGEDYVFKEPDDLFKAAERSGQRSPD
ncbi:Uu.00g082510.m01.CDS01 [Anthostomella pinea]|uniref:Uu.00g082510.m01.CDS01 n=1 Tax=Anthostomella pinea TaxID=933095 RepID=A0AAI8YJI3_9PEZI|nr:Uu.00g082510.m01.CDS01 [Anthostomella pinea]